MTFKKVYYIYEHSPNCECRGDNHEVPGLYHLYNLFGSKTILSIALLFLFCLFAFVSGCSESSREHMWHQSLNSSLLHVR